MRGWIGKDYPNRETARSAVMHAIDHLGIDVSLVDVVLMINYAFRWHVNGLHAVAHVRGTRCRCSSCDVTTPYVKPLEN